MSIDGILGGTNSDKNGTKEENLQNSSINSFFLNIVLLVGVIYLL